MREHVARLVHQVDAQIVVVDADVDVHAADDETPHHLLKVVLDRLVALLVGAFLLAPYRKRMGRRCDQPQPVRAGHRCDGAAQPLQIGTGFADGGAHPGTDLDLALQELGSHLPFEQPLALRKHLRGSFVNEVAGVRVDEEIFLLDPDGECWFTHG